MRLPPKYSYIWITHEEQRLLPTTPIRLLALIPGKRMEDISVGTTSHTDTKRTRITVIIAAAGMVVVMAGIMITFHNLT
jgi:hypothetical protein